MIKFNPTFFRQLLVPPSITARAGITASNLTEANHNAATYNTVTSCLQAINSPVAQHHSEFLECGDITLISWNIGKGKDSSWKNELKNMAKGAQFVLLQEAIFADEMKENHGQATWWSFSSGFQTNRYNSGIMTLSSVQPDLIFSLQKKEPWLRSPKIASITRFQIQGGKPPLVLVNIHQVNFTLGTKAFSRQLKDVASILKTHEGPIVLSGDFNTWNQSRSNILNQMTKALKLSPVRFSPDYRKKVLGHYLDHIFTRGFDVKKSHTTKVKASDHNPLAITLSFQDAS